MSVSEVDLHGRINAAELVAEAGDLDRARDALLDALGQARREDDVEAEQRAEKLLEDIERRRRE